MHRILLIGTTGQIGRELQGTLAPLGTIIPAGCVGEDLWVDLAKPETIESAIREAAPDVVINAAAYTAVDQAESEAGLAKHINADAPGVMAEAARRTGALLVHYSTDYVFDGSKKDGYKETDVPNPINSYGRSKLAGERAIEAVGGRYLILRTSWIYGLHGRNFLLTMLSRAKTQASLRVVDDQFGTPNWSRKVAEGTAGILSALDDRPERLQSVAETYHLSAQGETSWCRFARAILEIVGDDPGVVAQKVEAVTTADYPTPAKRPKHSLLDCDKLKRDLGIQLAHWKQSLGDCLRERGRPET